MASSPSKRHRVSQDHPTTQQLLGEDSATGITESQNDYANQVHLLSPSTGIETASLISDTKESIHTGYQQERRRSIRRCTIGLGTWTMATLGLLASLLSLTGLVLLLHQVADQPLPPWSKRVSVNTIISILSGVIKACLAWLLSSGVSQLKWIWFDKPRQLYDLDKFEKASEGGRGALLFMFDPAPHYVASVGAFLLVMLLAVDPFAQQLVKYYDCNQPTPFDAPTSRAIVSRTSNYTDGRETVGVLSLTLDMEMSKSIYLGLLGASNTSADNVAFECGTGNCTFGSTTAAPSPNFDIEKHANGSFSTLAMCYSCDEITSQVTVTGDPTNPTNYTLSTGAKIVPNLRGVSYLGIDTNPGTQAFDASDESGIFGLNVIINNCLDPSPSNGDTCPGGKFGKIFAASCRLKPCVKTFDAQVNLGVYTETETSTQDLRFNSGGLEVFPVKTAPRFFWSLAVNETVKDGKAANCNPTSEQTAENHIPIFVKNMTLAFLPTPTNDDPSYVLLPGFDPKSILWYPEDCVYAVNILAPQRISSSLQSIFANSVPLESNNDIGDLSSLAGDVWLQKLYSSGRADINTTRSFFEGLAGSITARLRIGGSSPNDTSQERGEWATGVSFVSQTCVKIEWEWIVPIAAFEVLTAVFLVMLFSQQAKSKIGKVFGEGSLIPLLFYGFDARTRERYDTLTESDNVEELSKNIRVQIKRDERDAVRFVEVLASERLG